MEPQPFHGHEKYRYVSPFAKIEPSIRRALTPLIPRGVETYHLTFSTLIWALLVLLCGWLARYAGIEWMWAVSGLIVLQHITDMLDGEVGKQRNTGLVRWGYYMDHFVDYVFLSAVLFSYFFILPPRFYFVPFWGFAVVGGFMVQEYLAFATTHKFRISYFDIASSSELRYVIVILNILLILFGVGVFVVSLSIVIGLLILGLCAVVYRTQKEIWGIDMKERRERQQGS